MKAIAVVEKVSPGYRLTKKGIQLWREFHVTAVTEVTGKNARTNEQQISPPTRKPSVILLTGDGGGP